LDRGADRGDPTVSFGVAEVSPEADDAAAMDQLPTSHRRHGYDRRKAVRMTDGGAPVRYPVRNPCPDIIRPDSNGDMGDRLPIIHGVIDDQCCALIPSKRRSAVRCRGSL